MSIQNPDGSTVLDASDPKTLEEGSLGEIVAIGCRACTSKQYTRIARIPNRVQYRCNGCGNIVVHDTGSSFTLT